MMSFRLCENLAQRQTLVQKLGLTSEYLGSCLVRTEARLRTLRYQRGLALLHGLVDESAFRSALDWLLVLFAPHRADDVRRYYRGEGPPLIESQSWRTIDAVDRTLDDELVQLAALQEEFWMLGLRSRDAEARALVDAYLEMFARPRLRAAA